MDETKLYHLQNFAISLTCALALLALLASLQYATVDTVPATGRLTAQPFSSSSVLFLASPIITAWGISASFRCSDKLIRRYLTLICTLLLGWMVAALWIFVSGTAQISSFFWYCYQIPLIFIPLCLLFCAIHLNPYIKWRYLQHLKIVLLVLASSMAILALANDAHHLFYISTQSYPSQTESWVYGPLYWVNIGWGTVLYSSALFLALGASRLHLRWAFVLVSLILLAGLGYTLAYSLDLFGASRSNFAIIYACLCVVALELCMDLGIVPSYRSYGTLFNQLPCDLKLLSPDSEAVFKTVFKSNCAQPTTPEEKAMLLTLPPERGPVYKFVLEGNPDVSYKAYRMRNGIALLTEDARTLNEEKQILQEQRDELTRQVEMLQRNHLVQHSLYRQAREEELFERLEASLQDATRTIRSLLDTMPPADSEAGMQARRRHFALIKLVTAYCKRKGSLLLATEDESDFDKQRLMLVVNEIITDIRTIGVEAAAIIEVNRTLPALSMNTLYDCLYEFISTALHCDNPAIMVFIAEQEEAIELRATMESNTDENLSTTDLFVLLRNKLSAMDVPFELTGEAGAMHLRVTVSCCEVVQA